MCDLRPKSDAQRWLRIGHKLVRFAACVPTFAAVRLSSCLFLLSISYSCVPLYTVCLHSDLSADIVSHWSAPMPLFCRAWFRVSLKRSFGLHLSRQPQSIHSRIVALVICCLACVQGSLTISVVTESVLFLCSTAWTFLVHLHLRHDGTIWCWGFVEDISDGIVQVASHVYCRAVRTSARYTAHLVSALIPLSVHTLFWSLPNEALPLVLVIRLDISLSRELLEDRVLRPR